MVVQLEVACRVPDYFFVLFFTELKIDTTPRCQRTVETQSVSPLVVFKVPGEIKRSRVGREVELDLQVKPFLNWANVCSPNILRTVRRTMIRFLIELLVRRIWFRQFDELYFVLNWLVMRCKLRSELAADAQQTA